MANLVHLRHPITGGECRVPASTATVLRSHSGWLPADELADTPNVSDTKEKWEESAQRLGIDTDGKTKDELISSVRAATESTNTPDLETEASDPESEED